MNSNTVYNTMKKLIEKKYYQTASEAQERADTFYACGRLTATQYKELSDLILEVYSS